MASADHSQTLPSGVAAGLAELSSRPIAVTEKGWGPLAAGRAITGGDLSAAPIDLHSGAFSLPLMILRDAALRHNVDGMAAYCAAAGVELAPHGKTMMAPQLAARQLAAGAWGISVATIEQLQAYRAYGFPRLFLANELVDRPGIAWLAGELEADPGFEAYCYVDSVAGVALLDEQWSATRRLPVVIELGFSGGRTGARSRDEAVAVAEAVAATETLRIAGVAGYEGGLGHDAEPSVLEAVGAFCADLRGLLQDLQDRGLATGAQILSAGGSAFFDVVVAELTSHWEDRHRPTVVIRSGAYITHDHGFYAGISPAGRHAAGPLTLEPAIEVWASVISRPEPELALLAAGRRDVPFDIDLPFVIAVRRADGTLGDPAGMDITALNDQHAYVRLSADADLAPGDAIGLGISHPCTAFDKWRVIPLVDGHDHVVDAVHTFF